MPFCAATAGRSPIARRSLPVLSYATSTGITAVVCRCASVEAMSS